MRNLIPYSVMNYGTIATSAIAAFLHVRYVLPILPVWCRKLVSLSGVGASLRLPMHWILSNIRSGLDTVILSILRQLRTFAKQHHQPQVRQQQHFHSLRAPENDWRHLPIPGNAWQMVWHGFVIAMLYASVIVGKHSHIISKFGQSCHMHLCTMGVDASIWFGEVYTRSKI